MYELLCVLLYLTLIVSPNTYKWTEIESIEQANQTNVDNVINDPTTMSGVISTYGEEAELIIVIDDRGD